MPEWEKVEIRGNLKGGLLTKLREKIMTNAEAIKWLELQRSKGVQWDDDSEKYRPVREEAEKRISEAYSMAIDALLKEQEVRHGHWVYKMRELIRYEDVTGTDPLGGTQTVTVKTHIRGPVPYCSLCDALAADSFLDYCPRCGAKMDEKEK